MIKFFKVLAHLEGYSFLALMFIAMPMKYIWSEPMLIRPIGMLHGLLFIAYSVMVMVLKKENNWSPKTTGLGLLAGILPFGTFWFVRKLKI